MSNPELRFHSRVELSDYPELATWPSHTLQALAARTWQIHHGPPAAVVEIVWMAETEHCQVHAQYLHDPTPTDVITFPYQDPDLFGEILINLDFARVQARQRQMSMTEEVALYVVHGLLHLLGFADASAEEQKQMRAAEAAVLGYSGA